MANNDFLNAMGIEVYRLRPTDDAKTEDTVHAGATDDNEQPAIDFEPNVAVESQPQALVEPAVQKPESVAHLNMAALNEVASICERCTLSRTRNSVVFGAGTESADLMFIGEAPGADEDREGLPFVGRAGKLLTSIVAALGFSRDEVYICNVVKCRPPNNRDPSPMEAKSCTPFLRRQIELIQPKVIVALGRVSAQLLLDTEIPLGTLRRQRHKFKDTDVDLIVTYHPAYLLRKPTEKAKVWEDLWNVRLLLKRTESTS